MVNLREQILMADDLQEQEVHVPEWDTVSKETEEVVECRILVVGLSAMERTRWEESLVKGKGRSTKRNLDHARASLVQRTARDPESRELIFSKADVPLLSAKASKPVGLVYDVAAALCGVSDADLEELVGNSEPT